MSKTATCKITVLLPQLFNDVKESDWYYEAVDFVKSNGIMTGLTSSNFGAGDIMSRAQFATILYRIDGEPGVTYSSKFKDVPKGTWYTDPIIWAESKGVVTGYSNGYFGINDSVTREQMATMILKLIFSTIIGAATLLIS